MENEDVSSSPEDALADIDRQHRFVAEQFGRYQWRFPVLAVVLGAAAASLMWRNLVWFCVVLVLFMVSVLLIFGTPARIGIVPRDGDRRSFWLLIVGSLVLFAAPQVAIVGPWWTSIAVGVFITLFVMAVGSLRLRFIRAELSQPLRTDATLWQRLIDRLAPTAPFAPVAALVLGAATVVLAAGHPVPSGIAALVYLVGVFFLLGVQTRIGEIPPDRRPSRFRMFVAGTVLNVTVPVILLPPWPNLWWPAIAYSVVVAVTVATVARWQRVMLLERNQHRAPR